MDLRAIATLRGEPPEKYQRTSVHVTLHVVEAPHETRFELAVMGDIRPAGAPDWQEGDVETGPNYHASPLRPGAFPTSERRERFVAAVYEEIQTTLQLRMRTLARSLVPGHSVLVFCVAGGAEVQLETFATDPPQGRLLDEFVRNIGAMLRDFIDYTAKTWLVKGSAPPPLDAARIKLSDEQAAKMYEAGQLRHMTDEQVRRLYARLGRPVPTR